MNGVDFLADTNVFIYAMKGMPVVRDVLLYPLAISVISEIELLGKKGLASQDASHIRYLLAGFKNLALTNGIKEIAIDLKQRHTVKVPDAIIAATAIYHGATLITADREFEKIDGLKLFLLDISPAE
ncbi:MAG: type II toxin-antitoxin system VapC family toxin [Tannerellaceae bacterium]|jgi:predicted nucleic acid-binding protein|nr:type II toxin-antitoxin system VapC family toxin [Tannerellaceae bacterium]